MQLEIERAGAAEGDRPASAGAPGGKIEKELADLREQRVRHEGALAAGEEPPSRRCAASRRRSSDALRGLEQAEREGDLGRAAELRYGTLPQLEKDLEARNRALSELQSQKRMLKEEVDAEDVAEVVAKWTGIPVTRMLEGEVDRSCSGWRTACACAWWARTRP